MTTFVDSQLFLEAGDANDELIIGMLWHKTKNVSLHIVIRKDPAKIGAFMVWNDKFTDFPLAVQAGKEYIKTAIQSGEWLELVKFS